MNKILAISLALFYLLVGATPTQAQPGLEVRQERTNPDGGFGFLAKRISEKLKLILVSPFPRQKEKAYENLINIRLAELKYVAEKPDMANFERATIRYSSTVGMWIEYIVQKRLDS